jgi:hypothetical protein
MRIVSPVTLTTAALAVAFTFTAAQPAEAGPACNRIGLGSPCIKSNDLSPRLNLDDDGRSARLRLKDADNENGVELDAGSATVTNVFSNDQNASNGLVKAWAQIAADGTIVACWRCNTDTNETRRIADGQYEVDFTPLATDITGRPLSGSIMNSGLGMIVLLNNGADPSSVFATTFFTSGIEDRAFVLIVY